MARYDPLPYVREVRPRNLRLADLYLRQGEQQAEAERRRGEIQAQMWGGIGNAIGQTASAAINANQAEKDRQLREGEQIARNKLAGLQVNEAERQVNDRENFDLAMTAGSKEKTLAALKDRPELYAKAQQHFDAVESSQKKLLGDVAAGIADFGYRPEAAMAAMDHLIEQGYDEKKIEPYRQAIQSDPTHIKTLVNSLLSQSPDPRHQAMAKPDLLEVSPGATVIDKRTGAPMVTAPNQAAEAAAAARAADDARQAAALEETKRHNRATEAQAAAGANDKTSLTNAGLDVAALNYRKTGVMPPLGMGDKGTRQRIINRAAELTKTDMARIENIADIAGAKQDYAANSASLNSLQKSRDAIGAFEQTAQKNIDVFLDVAGKVVDTGSPLANRMAREVSGKLLGSPDQAAYDAARQVAINEIAKITSNPTLAGQLSDSARHEVDAFNPREATLAQSVQVMRLLKTEMQNRALSLDQELSAVRQRGKVAAPDAPIQVGPFTVKVKPK